MATTPWKPPRLAEPGTTAVISPRLAQILVGICHGHTDAEIGRRLHITADTVKTHVRRLLAAMGATNRQHAAALAASGQLVVLVDDPNGGKP